MVTLLLLPCHTLAQPPEPENPQAVPPPPEGMVQLDLPDDVELKLLVDYVSKRLGINIFFDETLANKKLTLRAAMPIPVESLLPLLESAVRAKGMILIDDPAPGWKRIVEATTLPEHAVPLPTTPTDVSPLQPATQAFVLQTIPAQRADQIIKPFLTKPGGASLANDEAKLLIVTDFGSNLRRIEKLLEWIDQPSPKVTVRFIDVKNLSATELATQLTPLLAARSRAKLGPPGQPAGAAPVEIASDDRTNQLVLIGTEENLREAQELIARLDVPVDVVTLTYRFRYVAAERVDQLMKQLIATYPTKKRYSSALDADSNMLVVTASPDVQRRVEEIKQQLDVAESEPQSPIRFYQLKNASVDEVLATIRAIQGNVQQGPSPQEEGQAIRRRLLQQREPPPGPNFGPPPPGQPPPEPPVMETPPPTTAPTTPLSLDQSAAVPPTDALAPGTANAGQLGQAPVSSDPSTNTIIVLAPPEVQKIYAELIKRLDRRRPQVLLEITIVTVDCRNTFLFGVEFSDGDRSGLTRLFALTSYGLSQVNPVTGALQIIPGTGFNGTLVDPKSADAVLRALATHSRAKVVAAPRILVNDNATGVLTSVNEFPFSSVNASNTVATTSFGGFSDAGTTITVTPRISEGDHLQLNVNAELSSFTGSASEGLPPPRQNNAVESDVTIPDGYTVILGGLRFSNVTRNQETVPFLEHIPVIKYLVSKYNFTDSTTNIYFFIKPIILRDDQFRVLKHFSDKDICRARIQHDFPTSEPLLVSASANDPAGRTLRRHYVSCPEPSQWQEVFDSQPIPEEVPLTLPEEE